MSIGTAVYRWRWIVVAAWAAVAAALVLTVRPAQPGDDEKTTFLPADSPYVRATDAFGRLFPHNGGLSEAVVVFERSDGALTQADRDFVESVAQDIDQPFEADVPQEALAGLNVRSPADLRLPLNPLTGRPVARNPMVSRVVGNSQAALIKVSVPANFITMRSARVVEHIRRMLEARTPPPGLSWAVTGSSAFGHDYAAAAKRSNRSTLYVTLAAVIIILLVVYRAPLAAGIALGAITLAATVAMCLLALCSHLGLQTGTAERIFVIVLLYGAGVDYSLMLISRYREFLAVLPPSQALARGLDATFAAILASAGTDAAGLLMLCFGQFGLFRSTGPVVAMALVVALIASVSLVPALLGIFGRRTFWPAHRADDAAGAGIGRLRFWPRLAAAVTARPALTLVIVLGAIALPVFQGARLTWVYDTLADLKPHYGAVKGMQMAKRHWPIGEIAPAKILLESPDALPAEGWMQISGAVTAAAQHVDGVTNVRSYSQPLGNDAGAGASVIVGLLGQARVRDEYLSRDGTAMRLEAVLDRPSLTLGAMDIVRRLRQAIRQALAARATGVKVLMAGTTAEMMDIRRVTDADFRRIAPLVLGVIFLIVLVLLRDWVLSAFMTACTVMSFLTALGISYWVFTTFFGAEGLDWKVRVFLFVVIAAVGVDYNIFLAARLAEERRRLPVRQAVQQAIIHTGPVISSCGIIMAATLGSLMAGDLALLEQLGFAMATGMLVDTFVVRPLLLPAFVELTGRAGRNATLGHG